MREVVVVPGAELGDVVRSAGLGTRAQHRALPAAEGLALHDRAGDVPVDVGVADLDAVEPVRDLVVVEEWMPPVRPKPVSFCQAIASSRSRAAIRPSTGPKHSVRWNQLPGDTQARTPGVHTVSETRRGRTSHRSPAPAW